MSQYMTGQKSLRTVAIVSGLFYVGLYQHELFTLERSPCCARHELCCVVVSRLLYLIQRLV